VIKPGDSIVIPLDVAGEYYLMGNLNRSGSVEMTGGMVTLKQAIATAGNLGPLAWPKRCEIVRRVGGDREVTVRVDLEKIFNGEQPDIYIKPHDIINVGTHATSIWRAVLRNSFRATYGFGFVYDRNFAANDYYSSKPVSEWF
jgi:protein involved in polysaccharide export with SLBB domain